MLYSELMLQSLRTAWVERRLWPWMALYGVVGLSGIYTLDLLASGMVKQFLAARVQSSPVTFAVLLFTRLLALFLFVAVPAVVVRLYQNPYEQGKVLLQRLVRNGTFWFLMGMAFLFAMAYYRAMEVHVLTLLGLKLNGGGLPFAWEDGIEIVYALAVMFAPVLIWRATNPLMILELNFREIGRNLGGLCFIGLIWIIYSAVVSVGINWLTFAKLAPALRASKVVGIAGASAIAVAVNYLVYLIFLLVPTLAKLIFLTKLTEQRLN